MHTGKTVGNSTLICFTGMNFSETSSINPSIKALTFKESKQWKLFYGLLVCLFIYRTDIDGIVSIYVTMSRVELHAVEEQCYHWEQRQLA